MVFHASLLLPYRENTIEGRVQDAPAPVILDGCEEYVVEKILAWKPYYNARQFLVKFTGYDNPADNRWIHEGHLEHCQDIIDKYLSTNPTSTFGNKRRRKP